MAGRPVQLEQVMINLISNGVQAIDEADGSVRRVTIESRPCTSDVSPEVPTENSSPIVRVTVSDTGPGLDVESQHALFDLVASRRGSPLGIGLPISRDIVEGHGGTLWAEPNSCGGAAFHVMLPLGHAGGNDE